MTRMRFEIEKRAPYMIEETIYEPMKINDKHAGFKKVKRTREVTDGYMVYFPAGHSITVEGKHRLMEMGLIDPIDESVDGISVVVSDARLPLPSSRAMPQTPTPKQAVAKVLQKANTRQGVTTNGTSHAELLSDTD